jgi:aspartate-semialdehyde dehydrogenase
MDMRFVALAHNTIRGAAGGSVLNAELMYAQGMLDLFKQERVTSQVPA